MVKSRQLDGAVTSLQRLVDKIRGWGIPAAFVVSTREGALLTQGSPAMTEVIRAHSEEILGHNGYIDEFEAAAPVAAPGAPVQVVLPLIEPPLSQQKFQSCR